MSSDDPEVRAEQAYLDGAYRCLAAMRDSTAAAAAIVDSAAQAVDSAVVQAHLRHRLSTLDTDVAGLGFGRIDEAPLDGAQAGHAPSYVIGRRHVEDARGDPVVVDWRAPVAVPFYRATASDPFGLTRRRRFLMSDRCVDDVFDEVFDDPDSVHAAMHGGIPDPLLAELERGRTGAMRDIVATIQAEQDVVIRAPLEAALVVQGGPGTGKTAVGLHRAAFLLYEHRQLLDEQGVLVLGPNPVFLRYIAQVLPSLGESAVRQTTVVGLLGGRVRAFDSPVVAALKGDARMPAVIDNAVAATVRAPSDDLEFATPWGTVRLRAADARDAIDEVLARDVPHNVGRRALRTQVTRLAERVISERHGVDVAPLGFADELRTNKAFQDALSRWWPAVSAAAVVRRLLSSPTALRSAAGAELDAAEQQSLLRKPTPRAADEPWTAGDLVLVDEAEARVDGVRRTYGHVVVDEAQDLTAMEVRLVARRCPSRSVTILGDLAQATRPGAQTSWADVIDQLGGGSGSTTLTELDLGYRVPEPIVAFANRLLATAAPGLRPTRSVRTGGEAPVLIAVGVDELAMRVEAVVAELAAEWSSVGVVVPSGAPSPRAEAAHVLVVTPAEAKGLEFDAVVVVEPAMVVDDGIDPGAGARLLYVALTRAVQTLTVIHALPLPEPLRI
ncbi:MAG: HelD family protein [Acidimicrobiales bacterium]